MKIVGIMPIKLKNERLQGKNLRLLGEKPLLQYELDNLNKTELVDMIYVYCSSDEVIPYIPEGIHYLKRPKYLDEPTSNFNQIMDSFIGEVDADIYVYIHATAPYVSVETMIECIEAVKCGEYDSAFCATVIQDYLWQNGKPVNFDANNIPRSQDIQPIYRETSGVYVFKKEMYARLHRRVGEKPYIKAVSYKEAVDINNPEDFILAEALLNADI